ncbi:MAG: hypothetical protein RIC16_00050 [Rhodospirillales bacterium]
MKSKTFAAIAFALPMMMSVSAYAEGPHVAPIMELIEGDLKAAMSDATVIDAIKAQNAAHASLSADEIDALDKQWRAEVDASSKPLIEKVAGNPLSAYLSKVKSNGGGLYTEIFVMDNKGLNVGMSDTTSDYWQGDEGKFQKTFGAGANGVFVDEVEEDESSQTLQSQASFTITDGSGAAIGAVTFGINVNDL